MHLPSVAKILCETTYKILLVNRITGVYQMQDESRTILAHHAASSAASPPWCGVLWVGTEVYDSFAKKYPHYIIFFFTEGGSL